MTKEEAIEILKRMSPLSNALMPSPQQAIDAVNMAIEALSVELPAGLDEAAEKWKEEHFRREYYQIPKDAMSRSFKAGAEWMAGQGESHETEIVSRVTGNGLLPAVTCLVNKSYKEGDKVVVQIRKK